VNERRVAGTQVLRDGDAIRIGNTVLEVRLGTAAADTLREPVLYPTMPVERGGSARWPAILGLLVGAVIVVAAVAAFVLWLGQRGGPPTVAILSPGPGAQAGTGGPIALEAAASGAQDIVRLEMSVDDALVATSLSPDPAGTSALNIRQPWTFTQPGAHVISARAYTAQGKASDPAVVSLIVVEAPTQPAASPSAEAPTGETSPSAVTPPPTEAPPASPLPSAEPPTAAPPATSAPTATAPGAGGGGGARPAAPGVITDFEAFGTWRRGDQPNGTFTQSAEQVHGGAYAGKLAYDFPSGGNDYVVFLQKHKLGGRPNQISAWVYGDGRKHFLNVWIVDASGETWQFSMGKVSHTGWQQMAARLDPAAPWPAGHVDGPSNGAIEYPIDFRGLVLDDVPDGYTGSGAIYLDDLRCDEVGASPPSPTPTPTVKPAPGPIIQFWADATSIPAGGSTTLHWHVENVQAIYLDGAPVTGPDGQRSVSPATTTTYQLRVVRAGGEETREVTITVTGVPPGAEYDLYVRRIDYSPADPLVGDTIRANIMIATDISPAGGPYFPESRFRWRAGPGYDWNEEWCPTDTHYASCSKSVTFSYAAPGSYLFEVEADSGDDVPETNEDNNTRQWTIDVGS
jgi:hypothetical protein